VNMVLKDVTETEWVAGQKVVREMECILLNGNLIAMIMPL